MGLICMNVYHRGAIDRFAWMVWFIMHICCGWIAFIFPTHHKHLPHRLSIQGYVCVRTYVRACVRMCVNWVRFVQYPLCQMTWEQIMSTKAIKIPFSVVGYGFVCFPMFFYVDIQFGVHTVEEASAHMRLTLLRPYFTT